MDTLTVCSAAAAERWEGNAMAGESLVNVTADTIENFLKAAENKVGEGKGEIGVTNYTITPKPKMDGKTVSKISFSVDITIKRAHWSGGKADARQAKAIKAAEDLNAAHEEKHRKIAQDICDDMFPEAEKDLVGKTQKDIDAKIKTIKAKIDKAYEALDKREGAVEFEDDESKGEITVKLTGA
jgi:hypothetical protein